MSSVQFQCAIPELPLYRADAVTDDCVFEVLLEVRDARRLRTALMELARIAEVDKARRIVLVLEEPKITESRLRDEWIGAGSVLRPELFARLGVVIRKSGKWMGIPVPPAPKDLSLLDEILRHELSVRPASTGRGALAHHDILRILVHQWLLGKGPITVSSLMKISGTSHPTVARSLERFSHSLKRHSDRSVELQFFPRDEWAQLLAVSDEVRGTVRFADTSGQARSPESLLRRLRQINREHVAIGGVLGAKHYQPSLDLVGIPRLDISIHCGRMPADLSFVQRLDPGLRTTVKRDQFPSVVIHVIRRTESFFQTAEDDLRWADPVECLLDLHESRLESQALEFLNSFPATKGRHS